MRTLIEAKFIFITIFIAIIAFPIIAESLSTADHTFNPSLLSTGHRSFFELGLNLSVSVSNNYFSIQDIFTEHIKINLDNMYKQLKEPGLQFTTRDIIENHLLLSLFGISAGAYITMDGLATVNIPGAFLGLLANGNKIDEEFSASTDIYCQVFLETGIYTGYRWNNIQFSAKVGIFAPVAYSNNGAIHTSFTTDSSTGETSAAASLNVPILSAFNFDELSSLTPDKILEKMNGVNVDIGAIYMEKDKTIFGIHLNNIPLKPACVNNQINVCMSAAGNISNPLDNIENEEEIMAEEITDFSVTNSTVQEEISMPIEIGTFYRMTFLPNNRYYFKRRYSFY